MSEKRHYAYVEVTYVVPVPVLAIEREEVFAGNIDFEYDILNNAEDLIHDDPEYYLRERSIIEWTTE